MFIQKLQQTVSPSLIIRSAAVMALVLNGLLACADEERPIEPTETKLERPVEFDADILPILRANCVACHNQGKSEGDLNLETSQSIMKGGSSGDLVVPGKPEESYLYQVAARMEESFMPPWPNEVQAQKLTPEQLGLLKQWIAEGAKAGTAGASASMQWQTINNGLKAIYAVDADPFGRFVAAGRAGSVDIYDLLAKENVTALLDPALTELKSASQTAHRDYVHALTFHPNGQMLATSGYQVVKLWERDIASLAIPVPGKAIAAVTSADGIVTAIHRVDKTIVTQATGNVTPRLKDIDAATTLLAIGGPKNNRLVTATADAVVNVIDVANGTKVANSEALAQKLIQAAITADGNKVIVLTDEGTLIPLTLDADKKKLTAAEPLKSDKGPIRQIVASATSLMCRVEGNTVELRKLDSLKPGVVIKSGTPISSSAISSYGERIVTVNPEGVVELWNSADGKRLATLSSDLTAVRFLATAAADKAVRDARVTVVKAQVTEDEKRVTEQKESLKKAEEEIKKATEAVAAAKKKAEEEGPKVAAAQKASDEKPDDAGLKKKLEAAQKAEQTAKDAVTKAEDSLKSAQKGKQLTQEAIKRAEGRVAERKQALAAVEGEAKSAAEAHTAADAASKVAIASQHATFVGADLVATIDGGNIRLWKAADGSAVDFFPSALTTDNAVVSLTGAADALGVIRTDGQFARVTVFPKWKLQRTLGPKGKNQPSEFVDRVLALAFSPDGKTLAAGGGEASRSGELTLWNVADGMLIRRIEDAHSDTVYGVDFSADGKMLASASADKFVKVFDLATGEHIRSYEGHTHHVMDVSWKGDGTKLASAGADNAIKVWNAETGEQSRTISTYKKQVTSLSFIGMEDEFISCSGDKRVFRHRAANGGTVREFKGCPDYVYCSATTPDGMIVAAGCEDGILRIWNGKDAKEIATFAP